MIFLGKAWRLLVGIKDGLVLIAMLLFFGALYTFLSGNPNAGAMREGALLVSLDGTIVEQPESTSPQELLTGSSAPARQHRLRDVVHGLEYAATDKRVKVIALDLDSFWGGGHVALQRVGEALDKVRKAGKPIIAYATGYSDDSYQLAAHASEIWLDPMGMAFIAGPGGAQPYYKGLIDKLGVNVHVYRVGKFKSFVEPYIRTEQSPEAKQAGQELADAIFSAWKADVGAARPKARIDAYIADPAAAIAGGSMAQGARANGLVDKLGDRLAWARRIGEIAGTDSDAPADTFRATEFADYIEAHPAPSHGEIGIVTIAGDIVDGEAPAGTAGGETISRLVLDGLAQGNLKALVVRIDSPGGSAIASEKMRQAILEAKKQGLPVVVSMGNVAASGGYWVSTVGDKVFAEPATITGSIGVFGIIPTFENTLAKAGVSADGVQTTPLSGQPDILRGTNDVTDRLMQGGIDDIYARFTKLVASERKLPLARVQEIAQGRVWDGGTARQIGLIDAFGSLDDAIAEAARRAKLDPKSATPFYLEHIPNWFELMAQGWLSGDAPAHMAADPWSMLIARQQATLATGLADGLSVLSGPAVQVRCLSCPAVPRPEARDSLFKSLINKVFS
jgi:protease-4